MGSPSQISISSTNASIVARLGAARIDGRSENLRHRQDELRSLHEALSKAHEQLQAAMLADTGHSAAEINLEFSMALQTVCHHYDSLDFRQAQDEEYQVEQGHDHTGRRMNVGVVYIRPSALSSLFSVVAPLAAAMAAGNVLILEVLATLYQLPHLLSKVLVEALDADTFAIVSTPLSDEALRYLSAHRVLTDLGRPADDTHANVLASCSGSRVIGVVDRTADITQAAKAIVRARFAFQGKSVYAPDVILVNEFVKSSLLESVVKEATVYLSQTPARNTEPAVLRQHAAVRKQMASIVAENRGNIIALGEAAGIMDLASRRDAAILATKMTLPLLVFLSCTSLDDAINFASCNSDDDLLVGTPYLASYVFGSPEVARYLSQGLSACASFLNHIPVEILVYSSSGLVGPAGPAGHPLDAKHRYTKAMFEVPRPQFVANAHAGVPFKDAVVINPAAAAKLLNSALKPLKPTDQPFQVSSIGFFEQGLLTSLAIAMTPVVVGIGYGMYLAGKWLLPYVRR
ncbi:hypothetical protein N7474_005007 [Penicillium riverlandense]|uniref:uncharacterized protein n=1 Tax=Penicillium riverlandense TaxID=1903569 RepID=UPI002546E969|nr:uncharacterized protein N7474_005007 [Penicillium riverlandense]KAJ5819416.1 hypothetical protein N7474_005007 [Penicillium riverlandense]